jgi:hypothetical protein
MPDRINGMRCYTLLIPGVMLTLILAKHVPRELTNITLSPSPDNVIGVSDEMYRAWISANARELRSG